MSRVGKNPVFFPKDVVILVDGKTINVKGPKGVLSRPLHPNVTIDLSSDMLVVKPIDDTPVSRSMWGTTARNIKKMVEGVTDGFKKILDIEGVGFRAFISPNGKMLRLALGFSHDIVYIPCDGVSIACPTPNKIEITGVNCEDVGQTAAEIRSFKKPEPFKGKGIKYSYPKAEFIRRKQGKKK